MICIIHHSLGDQIKKNEMDGASGMFGGTAEMHTGFLSGDLMESDHLKDLGIEGIILNWIFKKLDGEVWTGVPWLRTGTGGGRLWMR
jgi:hypothetical protein